MEKKKNMNWKILRICWIPSLWRPNCP